MVMVKLGRDPAVGSSVMITAITDTGGFFIFPWSGDAVSDVSCAFTRRRRGMSAIAISPASTPIAR